MCWYLSNKNILLTRVDILYISTKSTENFVNLRLIYCKCHFSNFGPEFKFLKLQKPYLKSFFLFWIGQFVIIFLYSIIVDFWCTKKHVNFSKKDFYFGQTVVRFFYLGKFTPLASIWWLFSGQKNSDLRWVVYGAHFRTLKFKFGRNGPNIKMP